MRARLLNLARGRNEEFEYVLTRYANERLLYRLSRSAFRDKFVLKGAMLFALWGETPHRATRDIDLLRRRGSNDLAPRRGVQDDLRDGGGARRHYLAWPIP